MIRYLSKTREEKLLGTAIVRLDFNTQDDWRVKASVPTIKLILKYADKVLIISHKGRPDHYDRRLSLKGDAILLSKLLNKRVEFLPNFNYGEIKRKIRKAKPKTVFVLENIRFTKGESTAAPELARKLAGIGDYFVNDAFAVSHRSADSVSRIEKFTPCFAGLELEREIKILSAILKAPRHPLVLIIGGAKAHDKLGVLKNFKNRADKILLGGASANTFSYLNGADVKESLRETNINNLKQLKMFLKLKNLELPSDNLFYKNGIVDIGPKTIKKYKAIISRAKTIVWSGPMGYFEKKPYDRGTLAVASAIASNRSALSVTGGGETVLFLKKHKLDSKFAFISTGGGALLDYLAGKKLPGIEALKR